MEQTSSGLRIDFHVHVQIRTELLGSLLSATCILTPSIGKRLQEAQRGRGRPAKDLEAPPDSTEIFQISNDASERCRTVSLEVLSSAADKQKGRN